MYCSKHLTMEVLKMALVEVYPHKTGKKLNSVEIAALPETLTGDKRKEAINNDYAFNGYYTKENGEGKKVKTGFTANRGLYYDKSKLTDDELDMLKAGNFVRLGNRRTEVAKKSIKALINIANDNLYKWTEDQANEILACIVGEVQELENKLKNVKDAKEVKLGFQMSTPE